MRAFGSMTFIEKTSELQNLLNRVGLAPWHLANEMMKHAKGGCLAIDGGVLIAAPEALEGWRPEQVKFDYDPHRAHPFVLPPLDEIEKQTGPIKRMQWEESKFVILDYVCGADAMELELGHGTTESNTAVEVYSRHPLLQINGRVMTLLDAYVAGHYDFFRHLPSSLTVNSVVVTSDARALAVRRADHLFYSPGHWEISISEQMNADESADRQRLFFGALERSVREELGIDSVRSMVVTGLVREVTNLNINATALVHLHATADELTRAIALAEDGRELESIDYFDWTLEKSLEVLLSSTYETNAQSGPFVAAGRLRLLLAMFADFSCDAVMMQLRNRYAE